jgi:signal peptidase I
MIRSIAEWASTAVLAMFAFAMVAQPYVIPTGSMENNLLIGDRVLVDKIAYAPAGRLTRQLLPYGEVRRGDMIVFNFPLDPAQPYVKRAIGMPGDRIHIVNKEVWVNGAPLAEP